MFPPAIAVVVVTWAMNEPPPNRLISAGEPGCSRGSKIGWGHGALNNWGQYAFKYMKDPEGPHVEEVAARDLPVAAVGSLALLVVGVVLLATIKTRGEEDHEDTKARRGRHKNATTRRTRRRDAIGLARQVHRLRGPRSGPPKEQARPKYQERSIANGSCICVSPVPWAPNGAKSI